MRRRVDLGAPPPLRDTLRASQPSAVRIRLRAALPIVLQCAVAAPAAWWVSEGLIGYRQPLFAATAATAAVVCLAAGIGGRARQAVELLVCPARRVLHEPGLRTAGSSRGSERR